MNRNTSYYKAMHAKSEAASPLPKIYGTQSHMKNDKTYAGGDQGKTNYQQLEIQENKKQQDAYNQARSEFGDDFNWKRDKHALNKRIKEIKLGL